MAFLSKSFVAIKINAEKGEGPDLAKRFGVSGFPTMLVVDPKGEEVDRVVGFRRPKEFVAALKPVLDGKETYGALKKKVAVNPKDYDAALALGKKYEDRDDYGNAEELYKKILADGEASASLRLSAEGRMALMQVVKSRGKDIGELEKFFDKHSDSKEVVDQARLLFMLYSNERLGQQNTKGLIKVAEYLLKNGAGNEANFLNEYAWYLATHDVEVKKALEIAKKAVELEPKSAAYVDTLAEAYFRNGLHEEAVTTQKTAVELAPEGQREEYEKRLEAFEKALRDKRPEATREF